MHDIEPHYGWRDRYVAEEDEQSPFFGRTYSEFTFSHKVYNYFIHPQWDDFGSSTLYMKLLFAEYDDGYAIIELIGEWNDCLYNDIMHLKRNVVDKLMNNGIYKYIVLCEHVLNFHSSDDDYYQEWNEEVSEEGGWIILLNTLEHVEKEMEQGKIQLYTKLGDHFTCPDWRTKKPPILVSTMEKLMHDEQKQLYY